MSFSPVVGRLLSTFTPDFTSPTRREIAVADATKRLLLDAIYGDIDCQEEEAVQFRGSVTKMGPFYTFGVTAGYVDVHPGPFSTPTDYAFKKKWPFLAREKIISHSLL